MTLSRGAAAYSPRPWNPRVSGVRLSEPLRIVRETLHVACRRVSEVPQCTLVIEFVAHNPSTSAVTGVALAEGDDIENIAFAGGRAPTSQELVVANDLPHPSDRVVAAVAVELAANATTTITLRATMVGLGGWGGPDRSESPLMTRHPWTAPRRPGDAYLRGTYEATRAPLVVSRSIAPDLLGSVEQTTAGIDISVDAGAPQHQWGGPFLGIGMTAGDSARVRARVGWEAAPRPWLVAAIVVDSDLQRRWLAAATAEAASESFAGVFPSFSLGAGVPVQFTPHARAGVRFVSTVHWPGVGVAFTFDVYPQTGNEETHSELAVILRTGF